MIVQVGKYNQWTYALDTVAKTLTIVVDVDFDIYPAGISSIYDITASKYIPVNGSVTHSSATGSPVWTLTFVTLPTGIVNSDTLVILLAVPDFVGTYSIEQYLSAHTTPVPPPFATLDAYQSNTKAAFSISKLFTDATRSLQVRRSSDNTTLDIGFVDNLFDVTSATAFIGGGSGFVSKWYDQSGNGNDAATAIQANQPQLVFGVQNSLPTLRFNGTSHTLETPAFLDSSYNHAISSFMLFHKTNGSFAIAQQAEGGGFYSARDTPANYLKYNANGIATPSNALVFNCLQNNSQQLVLESFAYDGVNRNIYVNGVNYVTEPSSGENLNASGAMAIGGTPAALGGGNWLKGDVFTAIYMKYACTQADMTAVKTKLGTDFSLAKPPSVMFDGNSRTYGFGSTTGDSAYPGFSYPSQLVLAMGGPVGFSFTNQALNGASSEALAAVYIDSNRFNTDGYCSKNIVVFSELIDSLIVGDTAQQALDAQNSYLATYKSYGYIVIVLTCAGGQLYPGNPDQQNAHGVSTNSLELLRLIDNVAMFGLVGTQYDYLIDVGASPLVGTLASTNNLTYWNTDCLHNNNAGYAVIAAMVQPVLQPLLA